MIVLSTELRILQQILDTVSLTGEQWLVCLLAGSTVLVASEIEGGAVRHRGRSRMTTVTRLPEEERERLLRCSGKSTPSS